MKLSLLPSRPPFLLSSLSVPDIPDATRQESRSISNPELLNCIGNQDVFYDLYIKLTNRAIDAYVKAGRRKFALRLHGSLAALDVLVTTVVHLNPSHGSHSQPPRSIGFCSSNIFITASSLRTT